MDRGRSRTQGEAAKSSYLLQRLSEPLSIEQVASTWVNDDLQRRARYRAAALQRFNRHLRQMQQRKEGELASALPKN